MTGTRGLFVVVEGADASGKSTQARRLAERLRDAGRTVVETFEPGSTMLGAAVRAVVLGNDRGPVDERAEALLMAADRAQHTSEVIGPALDGGADVVCDRYVPSSLVYQGVARRLGVDAVEALSRWATRGLEPDLVLVLDIDDDTAAARASSEPDRMEQAGEEFHAAVRSAYRRLAAGRGWVVVDGNRSADEVEQAVWGVVGARLPGGGEGGG